jgi:hypothetical protein
MHGCGYYSIRSAYFLLQLQFLDEIKRRESSGSAQARSVKTGITIGDQWC